MAVRTLIPFLITLCTLAVSLPAKAQAYSTEPVKIIMQVGRAIDVVARIVADRLTRAWGQQVVVRVGERTE